MLLCCAASSQSTRYLYTLKQPSFFTNEDISGHGWISGERNDSYECKWISISNIDYAAHNTYLEWYYTAKRPYKVTTTGYIRLVENTNDANYVLYKYTGYELRTEYTKFSVELVGYHMEPKISPWVYWWTFDPGKIRVYVVPNITDVPDVDTGSPANDPYTVYTITGQYVSNTTNNLPSGLYIRQSNTDYSITKLYINND